MIKTTTIAELMTASGVHFGTSGVRGPVSALTDEICFSYTLGFLQHLEQHYHLPPGSEIAVAGDLRPSTPRIAAAVCQAIGQRGYRVCFGGTVPTPALTYFALQRGIPSIMITGSHIPFDRNGIKFNTAEGEILKTDEQAIRQQRVNIDPRSFDEAGMFIHPPSLPADSAPVGQTYCQRYLDFFPEGLLENTHIGIYQHSSVARDLLPEIFTGLGATVTTLHRSEAFVPIDTEAIREQDRTLARQWVAEYGFDLIVSTDGDGDRPMVSDERGNWLRGDILGILTARHLDADIVVTPVSSNTAVEQCHAFREVRRTRIGSPYVIEAMSEAQHRCPDAVVVGYEANGGFLLGSPVTRQDRKLAPLPTRDATIVPLCVLAAARQRRLAVSALMTTLPPRYTASNRLQEFPTEISQEHLSSFQTGDPERDLATVQQSFGEAFGTPRHLDFTDGVRITFDSGEIVHIRPSGNAPELRCYTEAASETRAEQINKICLDILERWRPSP